MLVCVVACVCLFAWLFGGLFDYVCCRRSACVRLPACALRCLCVRLLACAFVRDDVLVCLCLSGRVFVYASLFE